MNPPATPSQTAGPYLRIGLDWLITEDLAGPGASGERIALEGRVVDGDGKPVNDAVVEIWQANAEGRYADPQYEQGIAPNAGFRGFGRAATDDEGRFRFRTIKPGRVPGPGGALQAPHIAVAIFMRGLLKQLVTRVYFPDDPANADDAVLQRVAAERRATLIAKKKHAATLEWNIVLQGAGETVFFDF